MQRRLGKTVELCRTSANAAVDLMGLGLQIPERETPSREQYWPEILPSRKEAW
ncbi:hypothetical protein PAXINDRAFT_165635 [Paxillus involutus ATCC 200175]|nr:hypothetical protein PAXINDRAFT_165635 [Paxillus involutus ATCC 200175]